MPVWPNDTSQPTLIVTSLASSGHDFVLLQVLDINDNPPFIIPQLEIFGGVVVNSSESFQIDVNAQDVDTQLNTNFYFDIDGDILASDGSVGLDSVAENAFLIDRKLFRKHVQLLIDMAYLKTQGTNLDPTI